MAADANRGEGAARLAAGLDLLQTQGRRERHALARHADPDLARARHLQGAPRPLPGGALRRRLGEAAQQQPAGSNHWRDFTLPARIKRDGIIANGYRYGDYRFVLDQHQVLDLLMGENLYENPYVFVREILQNALDASRLREHLEYLRGNRDFKAQPIRVSE
ncbi:MAG TPA: hypothetical protein VHG52_09480 [Thermomicrobiales bacterium]|nr:hypothetical protein [Thermomicrobiales bacterium]